MKLKNLLFFIIIVLSLYIYDPIETYSIIIDTDNPSIKQEIPLNVNAIHTIDIMPKMIPIQLFIKTNQLVKWKNKSNSPQRIICDDDKGNNIFISKELQPTDFHTFNFTKKGKYDYFRSIDRFNVNTIIVN